MEFLVEWAFGALIVVVGPLLTLLDLPGNTIMLAAGIGYAFFDEARYFDGRLLSALVLVYAFGEIWEFIVSFFGIRRHKVSWGAVFLIAVGTFIGAVIGTGFSRCWALFWAAQLVRISLPSVTSLCVPGIRRMRSRWPGRQHRHSLLPCLAKSSHRLRWRCCFLSRFF